MCCLFYCSFQIPIICHGIVNIFSLKFSYILRQKEKHIEERKKENNLRRKRFKDLFNLCYHINGRAPNIQLYFTRTDS